MMRKLFGGGGSKSVAAPPPPANTGPSFKSGGATTQTVDAIQKLGETEDLLNKRAALLQKKIDAELEKAKVLMREKNKKAALMAMKKKKMYESQLEQVENNILRIGENQLMLESTRTQVETLAALQQATHAGKQTMAELKIDNVDKVLEEINDQADQLRMVQDALGAPIGSAADVDEDELLGELEDLEAEDLDDQLLQPAPIPARKTPVQNAPAAAAAAPAKTAEELELEALQAEMA